ncbi:aquaporin AQPAe.a [Eurytemora carolleeae]|uniref:aquaporin AQPAe.a n=1 Tax=Eurytemora carolleeae TaxID=1294199 RepID=UPI000C77F4A6|nr:aquaporin AQPAe.a [Eurytemora carolleeae]XP_023344035.1 aquaporin AQPAe.a [Eurytemora carolleeae]|eukprot:XP_023344034.1 aquaporin AQPAe.a-like [Eurytemora affinis]
MRFPYLGLEELKDTTTLFKQVVAEFLGTLILVFVGCGSCIGGEDEGDHQSKFVRIALCFGVTVATLAQALGHVSGCHVNPAVTAGLAAGGKIGFARGCIYVLAQNFGAIAGAGLLRGLVSTELRGGAGLGATGVDPNLSIVQAVGVEMMITMVLVLTVYGAAADENNTESVKGSAPLAIGLSIATCHLFAIPLTGSSMNPARTLGPAVITGNFAHHWIYWVGPILGGVAAGLIYQLVLKAPEKKNNYSPCSVVEGDVKLGDA